MIVKLMYFFNKIFLPFISAFISNFTSNSIAARNHLRDSRSSSASLSRETLHLTSRKKHFCHGRVSFGILISRIQKYVEHTDLPCGIKQGCSPFLRLLHTATLQSLYLRTAAGICSEHDLILERIRSSLFDTKFSTSHQNQKLPLQPTIKSNCRYLQSQRYLAFCRCLLSYGGVLTTKSWRIYNKGNMKHVPNDPFG